jgi:hypothetical protein
MKTVYQLFEEQFKLHATRKWDVVYVTVDWHDTMMPSSYCKTNRFGDYPYYPYCLEALKALSDRKDIRLILYTSSYPQYYKYLLDDLAQNNIFFYAINSNPDEKNTETGDFTIKFYYNILLDDRAGFDPLQDWANVKNAAGLIDYFKTQK